MVQIHTNTRKRVRHAPRWDHRLGSVSRLAVPTNGFLSAILVAVTVGWLVSLYLLVQQHQQQVVSSDRQLSADSVGFGEQRVPDLNSAKSSADATHGIHSRRQRLQRQRPLNRTTHIGGRGLITLPYERARGSKYSSFSLSSRLQDGGRARVCAKRVSSGSPSTCSVKPCNDNGRDQAFPSTGFWFQRRQVVDKSDRETTNAVGWDRLGSMVDTAAVNGCVVSHKYQFVYIHVLKSGGMTMKSFLKKALCNGETSMPCENGKHCLQVGDCRNILRDPIVMSEYFIFSMIRNPLARMYSGYAMAQHAALQGFAFADFVLFPAQRRVFSSTDPVHYKPQHQFLFDKNDCPIVDYVLRMETIERDLQELLHVLQSPELLTYYDANGLHHQTDTDYGRDRMKEHNTTWQAAYTSQELVDQVVHDYERDFELFGYDKATLAKQGDPAQFRHA